MLILFCASRIISTISLGYFSSHFLCVFFKGVARLYFLLRLLSGFFVFDRELETLFLGYSIHSIGLNVPSFFCQCFRWVIIFLLIFFAGFFLFSFFIPIFAVSQPFTFITGFSLLHSMGL